VVAQISYNLGLSKHKPRFARFGYVEKSQYWALVWGTIVMAGTGAVLWFENTLIGLLTKLGWDVARSITSTRRSWQRSQSSSGTSTSWSSIPTSTR